MNEAGRKAGRQGSLVRMEVCRAGTQTAAKDERKSAGEIEANIYCMYTHVQTCTCAHTSPHTQVLALREI